MSRTTIATRLLTLLAAASLALGLGAGPAAAGGGGGGGGGSLCKGFGAGAELVLRDYCFEGTGHAVAAGTTLTVVNNGRQPHDVTAVDGSFGSGTIAPGDSVELTFDEPGVVPVYCTLHASREGHGMAGLLVVTDGDVMLPAGAATDPAGAVSDPDAGGGSDWWVLAVVAVVLLGTVGARGVTGWLARRDADRPTAPSDA